MRSPKIIIFTGPSAVGKSTVENYLFNDPTIKLGFSTSATTRKSRPDEINGVQYYFISAKEFDDQIHAGAFIEYSKHFDNKYGTYWSEIERIKKDDRTPFLEVETKGAINIMKKIPKDDRISIFLAPPTLEDLELRIRKRGTESEEQIKLRLKKAKEEISNSKEFDYIVVNRFDPIKAAKKIVKIIKENS